MRFLGISRSRARTLIIAVVFGTAFTLTTSTHGHAEPEPEGDTLIELGLAEGFAVLAGSGITSTGITTVSGTSGADVGSSPTPTFTDNGKFSTEGILYTELDHAVTEAKKDLQVAFDQAIAQTATHTGVMVLGGHHLKPGVYHSGSTMDLAVNETLTLDAEGDESAVFIFQAESALTTVTGSSIDLINGAQASNVFWYVGSSATLGTHSRFEGTIMASASITAATGAIINGRLLALNAAVTLDTNSIVNDAFVATAIPEPEPELEPEPEPEPELETDLEVDAETETSTPRGYYPRTSTEVGGVIPNTGTNGWFFAAMVGLGISLAGVLALPKLRRHG